MKMASLILPDLSENFAYSELDTDRDSIRIMSWFEEFFLLWVWGYYIFLISRKIKYRTAQLQFSG